MIVQSLKKSFANKVIVRNFSYVFPENSIIALVGVNGAGKTTLLKMLCGVTELDGGLVTMAKDKLMGYLPQEPNPNPKSTILEECCAGNSIIYNVKMKFEELENKLSSDYSQEILEEFEKIEEQFKNYDGYRFEDKAQKILQGLGFKPEQMQDNPENVSGGWRMRLEIARLLMQSPDLLILDEPTNHLDMPSIEWLENYLKKFRGSVVFVSHDEALLNSLPDIILHISHGIVKEYHGNYEDFMEQKLANEAAKEKTTKNIGKKIQQLSKFVDRFKAKASLAKQAQNKMKAIAKLNDEIADLGPNMIEPEINIRIPIVTQSGKSVMQFKGNIGYDKPLLKNFSFEILRGQKVAVIGANGLGKSTMLKTIMGEIAPLSGDIVFGSNVKVGYYAQDQAHLLNLEKNIIENMKAMNSDIPENKLMRILGSFLFKKDDIYKPCAVLSGGEKSRLSLAALLIRDLNFLILDEPTNHLDIMSTNILANSLDSYEGTVLFVSHNRTFIDNLATHLLIFENNEIIFTGC